MGRSLKNVKAESNKMIPFFFFNGMSLAALWTGVGQEFI